MVSATDLLARRYQELFQSYGITHNTTGVISGMNHATYFIVIINTIVLDLGTY
jgi:hypothetical protein